MNKRQKAMAAAGVTEEQYIAARDGAYKKAGVILGWQVYRGQFDGFSVQGGRNTGPGQCVWKTLRVDLREAVTNPAAVIAALEAEIDRDCEALAASGRHRRREAALSAVLEPLT